MKSNEDEGVCYAQPHSLAQRVAIANDFIRRFRFPLPLLVDDMDNHADALYAGWPERLYVVTADGAIAYKGNTGPFGYHPEEVAGWLEAHLEPISAGAGH